MAKQANEPTVVKEVEEAEVFPVTITEFLSDIPQSKAETKAGFLLAVTKADMSEGKKTRSEWSDLLALFGSCPTKIKFADWVKRGGK